MTTYSDEEVREGETLEDRAEAIVDCLMGLDLEEIKRLLDGVYELCTQVLPVKDSEIN